MNKLTINQIEKLRFQKTVVYKRNSPSLPLLKLKELIFFIFLCFLVSTVFGQNDYYDRFSTVSYDNNDGVLNFAGNWIEIGDGGGSPSNGRIRIAGNRLRFNNLDGKTISRALNLGAPTSVNLTFTYDANSRGNETLLAQLWNDSASSWETIATLNTTTAGTISHALTTNQISTASAIRFISGSGGWSNGERIFIDDVRFIASLANTDNTPPNLTATGNQNYCPQSDGPINIVTAVSITDPDDISTNAIYIQISSGYVNGEDLLELGNLATHASNGITQTWNAIQGELTLNGSATYTAFEAAILDVLYSSSSTSTTGTRQFSITVGEANYLPNTTHYYEFIADPGITWTEARDAADAKTYFGLQGYLATLTSQEESDFSGSQALGVGWIGASDAASEGDWRWVTGPEAGTPFWSGAIGGSTTAPYNYAFWNANEPNNSGNEDYAHISHPNVNPNGSWNDLPNAGSTDPASNYHPQGYVVEYGGSIGDPVINVTAITQITFVCVPPVPEIMITQYYQNGNSISIEIKNISASIIPNNRYYLGAYVFGNNISNAPTAGLFITALNPGQVRVYTGNGFTGNELLVISTTNGPNCYAERVDIIGDNVSNWGSETSFTKGSCATEIPHLNFDTDDWIEVDPLKVSTADNRQNIALGTYRLGIINWNGASWTDAALPDLSCIAIIDDTYNANMGNIEAGHLIINSALNFDNGTTNSVVVYENLTINGTFTIGDTESLVMYDDNALIVGNIIKNESSAVRNSTYDFTYWSSSTTNATIGTTFSGVTPSRIFLYDQSQSSASDSSDPTYWNTWVIASGAMSPGKGYATEGLTGTTGNQNISFSGTPNNGVINVNVFEHNDSNQDNDFNLIGNPYPSAIDIEEFFNVNSGMINPTVYLWTHNTPISNGDSGDFTKDDYATYNFTGGTGVGGQVPDKNIGSGQGFFIRAINSGNVVFDNSMRMEGVNNQFFKSNNSKNKLKETVDIKNGKNSNSDGVISLKEATNIEFNDNSEVLTGKDRIWLNLRTNNGGFNQQLIGFMENASEGVDYGYDALKFEGGNTISFYSTIENEKYAIQGLSTFSFNKTIKLGFDTTVAPRVFTISIEKLEGVIKDSEVYLVDNLLNITHDLKNSDYQFDVEEVGENFNRFTLQFIAGAALAIDDVVISNENFIVSNEIDGLKINADQTVRSIKIYDILGRMLIANNPNKKSFELKTRNIKAGTVLLIEARLENNAIVSKKTIKL